MISSKTIATVVGAATLSELLLLIDHARGKGLEVIGDPHYNFRTQLWCQTVTRKTYDELSN